MLPAEGPRLADDQAGDAELAQQAGAEPARRERGDHRGVAVVRAAPGGAEGGGLAVGGGVAVLDAAVVTAAEQRAVAGVEGGADRDATGRGTRAGLGEGGSEHVGGGEGGFHTAHGHGASVVAHDPPVVTSALKRGVSGVPSLTFSVRIATRSTGRAG